MAARRRATRPLRIRRPWLALHLAALLLACAGATALDSADDGRVPCAELPEFAGLPNLPPIHGRCK